MKIRRILLLTALLAALATHAAVASGPYQVVGSAESREGSLVRTELTVQVGAHPGYADREHFGRNELALSEEAIFALCLYQTGALVGLAQAAGLPIRYLKPHGALYNQACRDDAVARPLVAAAEVLRRLWSWPLAATVLLLDLGWYLLAYREGGQAFLALQLVRENVDRFVGQQRQHDERRQQEPHAGQHVVLAELVKVRGLGDGAKRGGLDARRSVRRNLGQGHRLPHSMEAAPIAKEPPDYAEAAPGSLCQGVTGRRKGRKTRTPSVTAQEVRRLSRSWAPARRP